MKKINYLFILLMVIGLCFVSTGCANDEMDGIEIAVTNYANEYITNELYGKHSTIVSIYPDGVDTSTYKLSKKQKKEYAEKDIFVYNGLIENEIELAKDLIDINPNLKIIDTAYVLETDYSPEELWLNPASLLMMAQNVKNGLLEYISSTYLQKEISDSYDELKINVSVLDVDYRDAVLDAGNKVIVTDDSTLKYLEKFGLEVYCIDNDASDKTIATVNNLISKKEISYIIKFKNKELPENAQTIIDKNPDIKTLELHKLDVLTDEEREEKKNYLTIMEDNLNLLRQELVKNKLL